jgi:hypothetical protein
MTGDAPAGRPGLSTAIDVFKLWYALVIQRTHLRDAAAGRRRGTRDTP